jgi:hypothetical protein
LAGSSNKPIVQALGASELAGVGEATASVGLAAGEGFVTTDVGCGGALCNEQPSKKTNVSAIVLRRTINQPHPFQTTAFE